MKFFKLFFFAILSIIFISPNFSFAYQLIKTDAELKGDFSIAPLKYDLQIKAGEKNNKQIFIINRSRDTLNFKITVEDFIGSYDSEEQIKFLGNNSSGHFSLKELIKPEINNFVLRPGEQIGFNVEIDIPEDIESGSRYAAVFAEAQKVEVDQIQISSRLGTLFMVKVEGLTAGSDALVANAEQKAKIKYFNLQKTLRENQKSLPKLKISFENGYQTHLVPSGKISVFNFFNKKVAEFNIDSWYVLPESVREKLISLPDRFFFGRYAAVAEFLWQNPETGLENKYFKKISFWLFSPWVWKIILSIIALLILSITIFKLRLVRFSLFFLITIGAVLIVYSVSPLRLAGGEASAVMISDNYQIMQDSINVGGAETGNSANYGLSETLGEINGNALGTNYGVNLGYRVLTDYTLSISTPSNVTMPSCTNSATGCGSVGSVSWTVTTGYANGYTLSVSASNAPAMRGSAGSFPDFSPSSGTTAFWSIDSYTSAFGFSIGASGQTDIVSAFKDNGSSCGTGSDIGSCFRGFNGTNSIQIVSRSSAADSGNATTVNLKAEVGKNYNQPAGNYSASVTATATAL